MNFESGSMSTFDHHFQRIEAWVAPLAGIFRPREKLRRIDGIGKGADMDKDRVELHIGDIIKHFLRPLAEFFFALC